MKQDETITVKELAKITGKSERTIQRRAKKEGWKAEVINGRGDKRFLVNKLPESVRLKIEDCRLQTEDCRIQSSLYKGIAKGMPNPLTPALSREGRGSTRK